MLLLNFFPFSRHCSASNAFPGKIFRLIPPQPEIFIHRNNVSTSKTKTKSLRLFNEVCQLAAQPELNSGKHLKNTTVNQHVSSSMLHHLRLLYMWHWNAPSRLTSMQIGQYRNRRGFSTSKYGHCFTNLQFQHKILSYFDRSNPFPVCSCHQVMVTGWQWTRAIELFSPLTLQVPLTL